MATHYTATSVTKYHSNYGVYGDYKKVWYQFAITVTISAAGAVSYSITSTNNVSAIKGWSGCQTSAWIEINGTTVLSADQYGSGFPRDNNSTKSGSAGTTSSGSVTIKTKIIPGSDYTGWPDAWNASLLTSTVSRNYWTDNTAGGAPTITDSGNNNFSITGKSGTAGTSNSITETKLQYKIGGGSWTTDGDNSYSGTVTANTAYTARTRYKCSYGGDSSGYLYSAESSKTIYFYKAPGNVGTPALTAASFKNGRLTVKQNWTYTWAAASAGSTASPVQGYRIRMYKNGSLVKGITAGSGSNISKGTGTNEYLDRAGSTNCSITFNPVSFGFEPGDTVYIGVFAWATNGAGSVLWSGGGSTHVTSATTTVQNSGIMRVRPAGSWKEGVVSVKVDNKWIEADVVQIKADGKWKESE